MSERELWRAVILRAFQDATARPTKSNSAASAKPDEIKQARRWLTSSVREFQVVCDAAGLDGEMVREATAMLAQKHWPVLLFDDGRRLNHRGNPAAP